MERLICILGLAVFVALAWAMSSNRRLFPWRTVMAGLGLQMVFGALILRTDGGKAVFVFLDKAFSKLLSFGNEGVGLVFGPLADRTQMTTAFDKDHAFVFALTITGSIVLVSALSSLLYHYGVLQLVVKGAAWVMRRIMHTSGSETLAAAANIFMGQTEAPLVIKPYLARMTRSELMCLMVGGMATIAGGVLAAYVSFGISAGHLLTASVMSAPAAMMMAKILLPETEVSETAHGAHKPIERETANGIDALCHGASDGIKLAINVMAMLIAFVAVVALANYLLSLGLRAFGQNVPQPLQLMLGWLNAPCAWLMGVPWQDCGKVGALLGERVVLNEFLAYLHLSQQTAAISPRSAEITTYALCGFANFASIAIQIGGIGALVPQRRTELAQIGLKAMFGGLLACYCTACVAGLLL
ncbi:nucleoside transporter C-terminal domain-containing protein [Prosthecobacter sp.]|uniref:NupC/NupG family nucleoside CNT transporter n=1 Tax=Prosthecobacter sp. TaxID=1965333 RepID=UPI002ABA6D3E|nr:nucleoside transporter C-terminal domain-containing protein [Prosthecobacter sp.]MDZ4405930.1 nucleoside transporter C-terminal domain-containing protein [Prosthecobacter sp.]